MDYKELAMELDNILDDFGDEPDARLQSISSEDFLNSIEKSEQRLTDEYFKIEQIKIESLKDAMNERLVYI